MSHRHRHRSVSFSLSGSVVESDPTPTVSYLEQNSAVATDSAQTGIPLVASALLETTSVSPAASSTSTARVSTSSSGNQIPLGTVIGACVASLIALLLAVLLAFYCSRRQKQFTAYSTSRNLASNFSRSRSHQGPWERMGDGDGDRTERRERPKRQRPPSGTLGTMFRRYPSNSSGEKSSRGHDRESVGTMQNFAKYHPGLAAEMAAQAEGLDGQVTKPPAVHHFAGRIPDMDVDTVTGHSLVSLQSGMSGSQLHLAKATPPPTSASSLHQWESAEVLHTGSEYSDTGDLRNPFDDSPSSVKRSISSKGRNPFFSGRDDSVRRTASRGPRKNPFADPPPGRAHTESTPAIQSLIAALETPDRVISFQSSVYSHATEDDGDSTINVSAFPYPPTPNHLRYVT